MSKSEELRERIGYLKGFLTILAGIFVLTFGGLIGLYLKDQTNEIFWLGAGAIVIILLVFLRLMLKIENHLKELGEA